MSNFIVENLSQDLIINSILFINNEKSIISNLNIYDDHQMVSNITIIMYHYVRDLKKSKYSEIKGLDINLFKEQVYYLNKHYNMN